MKRKAGTVLGLSAPGLVDNQAEHHRQTAIVAVNKMFTIADDFNTAVAAAFEDRLLTAEGQAAKAAKATTKALASLDTFNVDIQKLMDRASGVERALRAKVAAGVPKDVAAETLREVRDQMRTLTSDERLAIYRASATDPLVLAAIETAPPTLGKNHRLEPFVDPTELASAQMERAEAADPAAATTMHDLRQLADAIRLAATSVRREIMDAAGVPVPE
jgi:hypothetical protein